MDSDSGQYELGELLGRGGMGRVLRAWDRALGREVALKLMPLAGRDAAQLERFRREGELTARLDHPGIVKVHGAGRLGADVYLAYSLVPGARPLHEAFRTAPAAQRVEWVRQAAEALAHAHARGVIHRDVKPGNVLIDEAGQAHVTDFGLARAGDMDRLTRTGALLGTPFWLAPEAFSGRPTEATADVWALGVMLYEALTGVLPFSGGTLAELWRQVTEVTPARPRAHDPGVTPALEAVCLHALAKRPEDRPADAGAFVAELEAALAGRAPVAARPRARALAALGLVVVACGLGGWGLTRERAAASSPGVGPPASSSAVGSGGATDPRSWQWTLAAGHTTRSRLLVDGQRVREADGAVTYAFHHRFELDEQVTQADADGLELSLTVRRFQTQVDGSAWWPVGLDSRSPDTLPRLRQVEGRSFQVRVARATGEVRCTRSFDDEIGACLNAAEEPVRSVVDQGLDPLRARNLDRYLGLLWGSGADGGRRGASWVKSGQVWPFGSEGMAIELRYERIDQLLRARGVGARQRPYSPTDDPQREELRVQLETRWGAGRVQRSEAHLAVREVWRGQPPTRLEWSTVYEPRP